jgi:hypothetical protein
VNGLNLCNPGTEQAWNLDMDHPVWFRDTLNRISVKTNYPYDCNITSNVHLTEFDIEIIHRFAGIW